MIGMTPCLFVEVCGALAPIKGADVELLHFKRCDRFREIICGNPELAACRDELELAGYDVDLGVRGLGNAKLLVRASLASRVIKALEWQCHKEKQQLTSSDVVVSKEFKPILLEQLQNK